MSAWELWVPECGVGGAERRVPQAMLETWESTQGAQGTTHTHEMSLG